MELKTYLIILWRRKWIILITAAVTVAIVAFGTTLITPKYIASATLRITPAVGDGWDAIQYTDRLVNTYVQLATSGPVLEELRQRLNLSALPQVDVEIPANTELMSLVVEDQDPVLVANAANTLAEILVSQSNRTRIGRQYPLSLVDPAVVPDSPASPQRVLNIALGLIIGLGGGLGLAFLFENLDTKLYHTKQIEAATDLRILGQIPNARRRKRSAFLNGNSSEGEAFRRLRTNIFALNQNQLLKTLLVTSAEPGEGKSTTVANLAYTIAQTGRKVLVIDGDMRLPTLHKIFELSNEFGLSSILEKKISPAEVVQASKIPGVQVLTSGPLPPNPAELIGSSQMKCLIEQLSQQFDLILLDSPALMAVTDSLILVSLVDGALFVVGQGQAQQETVQKAQQQLAMVKANLVGIVVNRAEHADYYNYYRRTPVQP